MSNKEQHTSLVKSEALRLGFDFCGVSKAEFLEEEASRLEQWLLQDMHGRMSYMQNYFDKRLDPSLLVPGAKSVISLLYNYYPQVEQEAGSAKISKYAYGEDYHYVVKDKLKELVEFIRSNIGDVNGRIFVDSAPVLERAWAKKSGLGWVGKNSNLITKQHGSFFFIAEIICDLELISDSPIEDYCGTCTRCLDACPTGAIIQPYVVDGSKCISYFTIELKEEIPAEVSGKMDDWIFGCDVCQDVCPWNRFSKFHNEKKFNITPEIAGMKKQEWLELTDEVFQKKFDRSALKRTGLSGIKRNINFLRRTS